MKAAGAIDSGRAAAALLLVLGVLLWGAAGKSLADPVPLPPDDPAALNSAPADPIFEKRLKALETELRCLVCQNQTLADSGAGLAEDLRREVRGLAVAGKSDEEIKQYLHDRYGNFIFYRPPLERNTWLLWFGPFVLLAAIAAWGIRTIARSRRQAEAPLSPVALAERQRVAELLREP